MSIGALSLADAIPLMLTVVAGSATDRRADIGGAAVVGAGGAVVTGSGVAVVAAGAGVVRAEVDGSPVGSVAFGAGTAPVEFVEDVDDGADGADVGGVETADAVVPSDSVEHAASSPAAIITVVIADNIVLSGLVVGM